MCFVRTGGSVCNSAFLSFQGSILQLIVRTVERSVWDDPWSTGCCTPSHTEADTVSPDCWRNRWGTLSSLRWLPTCSSPLHFHQGLWGWKESDFWSQKHLLPLWPVSGLWNWARTPLFSLLFCQAASQKPYKVWDISEMWLSAHP